MATREQIMAALFALGQGITWGSPPQSWVFTMRRVKTPDQIVGMMPALCQGEFRTTTTQVTRMPQIRTFEAAWFIYHYNGDDDAIMATTSNAILDAIDLLFPGDQSESPQTLGGLCHSAKIIGQTDIIGGNVDGQVLIVVPIQIIAP